MTTEQAFGDKLHTYTIINAINDKNVLRFRVDYERTMRMKDDVERDVWGIDTLEALHSPKRVSIVTRYILEHFAQRPNRVLIPTTTASPPTWRKWARRKWKPRWENSTNALPRVASTPSLQ